MAELPLVIVNMQRGGPSTGLPTKTEQADLLQAIFGRNGEAPLPIVAPGTPGDCFYAAYEACRIAVKLHDPGHPSLGRLPGHGLRALAHSERGRSGELRAVFRLGAEPDRGRRRRFPALYTRREDAGAALGPNPERRVSNTASAGWKKSTKRAMSRTSRRTTSTW